MSCLSAVRPGCLESHPGALPVADGLQAGCPSGQRERSVKPSAQPTLVRTQHLPPPAETAPWLRKRTRGAVSSYHAVYRDVSLRVDTSRCPRTYSGRRPGRQDGRCAPSAFPRTATDRVRGVPILASRAALSRALASGRECAAGGARCARRAAGGLRSDLLPGGAWWMEGFSGSSRAQGGWRRMARPAALREAWRHGMRIAVPRAGRPAAAGAAQRVARTDGHAGSARLRGCSGV